MSLDFVCPIDSGRSLEGAWKVNAARVVAWVELQPPSLAFPALQFSGSAQTRTRAFSRLSRRTPSDIKGESGRAEDQDYPEGVQFPYLPGGWRLVPQPGGYGIQSVPGGIRETGVTPTVFMPCGAGGRLGE